MNSLYACPSNKQTRISSKVTHLINIKYVVKYTFFELERENCSS